MNEIIQNVMQSYFHQDWKEEFSSVEDVVNTIVDENPANYVAELIEQIERLLDGNKMNAEISSVLEGLSIEYVPVNAREFLVELAGLLKARNSSRECCSDGNRN